MSFWKRLFGGGAETPATGPETAKVLKEAEHKGFTIRATPYPEAGQFQTAGRVVKTVDGVEREHRFIRADRFADAEAAADCALQKGRQLVDEQGERLFRDDRG
jgi:hypothetical protein